MPSITNLPHANGASTVYNEPNPFEGIEFFTATGQYQAKVSSGKQVAVVGYFDDLDTAIQSRNNYLSSLTEQAETSTSLL